MHYSFDPMQSIDVSQNRRIPMEDSHLLFDDRESCSIRPTASSPEKDVSDLSLAMVVLRGERGKPRTLARGRDGSLETLEPALSTLLGAIVQPVEKPLNDRLWGIGRRRTGSAGQTIGFRTIRPYAMNAMTRPSTPLKMMGVISRNLTCTPMNTRLSIARTVAATTVSAGCQRKTPGTISPTVQTSSRMPVPSRLPAARHQMTALRR